MPLSLLDKIPLGYNGTVAVHVLGTKPHAGILTGNMLFGKFALDEHEVLALPYDDLKPNESIVECASRIMYGNFAYKPISISELYMVDPWVHGNGTGRHYIVYALAEMPEDTVMPKYETKGFNGWDWYERDTLSELKVASTMRPLFEYIFGDDVNFEVAKSTRPNLRVL